MTTKSKRRMEGIIGRKLSFHLDVTDECAARFKNAVNATGEDVYSISIEQSTTDGNVDVTMSGWNVSSSDVRLSFTDGVLTRVHCWTMDLSDPKVTSSVPQALHITAYDAIDSLLSNERVVVSPESRERGSVVPLRTFGMDHSSIRIRGMSGGIDHGCTFSYFLKATATVYGVKHTLECDEDTEPSVYVITWLAEKLGVPINDLISAGHLSTGIFMDHEDIYDAITDLIFEEQFDLVMTDVPVMPEGEDQVPDFLRDLIGLLKPTPKEG